MAAVIFENPPENSEPFAEACLRFSPTISLKKHGVLFIEIGGSRLLFDEIAFSARMQVLLRRFQLSAKIQIANTLLEALILAEHGTLNPEKLSTRAFLDFADPFRSDPKIAKNVQEIVECLHQVGVKTIARFLNVPTGEISARFGSLAIFIKSRMTHEIGLAWPLWVPVEKIIELREFDEQDQFTTIESLLYFLRPTIDRIFSRLFGRGQCASVIRLQLNLEKSSVIKKAIREWRFEFIFPQTSARVALSIFRERLTRDLQKVPLEAPVEAFEFEVLQTVAANRTQQNFLNPNDDAQEKLKATFSQLLEGLGKGKVFRAFIHEEAVPEKSWSKTLNEQTDGPDLSDYIPSRPTKLLAVPEPVYVVKDTIFIRKKPYRVLHWSGVEQIATHWLEGEIARSYWRVVIEGKPAIWIFKTPSDEFFLHGYFG